MSVGDKENNWDVIIFHLQICPDNVNFVLFLEGCLSGKYAEVILSGKTE